MVALFKTLQLFFVAVIKNVAINKRNGIFEEESKKTARNYAFFFFYSLANLGVWGRNVFTQIMTTMKYCRGGRRGANILASILEGERAVYASLGKAVSAIYAATCCCCCCSWS